MKGCKNLLFYGVWLAVTQLIVCGASIKQGQLRNEWFQLSRFWGNMHPKVRLYYALDILTPTFLMVILVVAFVILWHYDNKHVSTYGEMGLEFVVFICYAVALLGIYSTDVRRLVSHHLGIPPHIEWAAFYTDFSGLLMGWAIVSLVG